MNPNAIASTSKTSTNDTVTLYRPTGDNELKLVRESGWRAWPPRTYWQPIFYPVLNFEYAEKIARDWNSKSQPGYVGYVTRFQVRTSFLDRYEVHTAGSSDLLEYWIPAEDLDELNANIVGLIEVAATYRHGGGLAATRIAGPHSSPET